MSHIERLGYFFHSSNYSPPLGHGGVEVFLSAYEDDWFFPTHSATFPLVDKGGIGRVHVTYPWLAGGNHMRLAPGRFFITANSGDLVEGFSFGGSLTIDEEDGLVHCQLKSSSPFFDMADTSGPVAIFAPEFEAELARLRTQWPGADNEFDQRVGLIKPMALFIASLLLGDLYTHRFPPMTSEYLETDERVAINHAIHVLKNAGQWPDNLATLHDLILGY